MAQVDEPCPPQENVAAHYKDSRGLNKCQILASYDFSTVNYS